MEGTVGGDKGQIGGDRKGWRTDGGGSKRG